MTTENENPEPGDNGTMPPPPAEEPQSTPQSEPPFVETVPESPVAEAAPTWLNGAPVVEPPEPPAEEPKPRKQARKPARRKPVKKAKKVESKAKTKAAKKPAAKKKQAKKKHTGGVAGRPKKDSEEDWGPEFLIALESGVHARDSAALVKINIKTAYDRRKREPAFDAAWKEAVTRGTEALEAETARRAYDGVLKPVRYKGRIVGHIREYSDDLLKFLLRSRRPDVYRDNAKLEHVRKDGESLPPPVIYLPENGRTAKVPLVSRLDQGFNIGVEGDKR